MSRVVTWVLVGVLLVGAAVAGVAIYLDRRAQAAGGTETEEPQGREVELERGQVYEVTLESNATTGYSWSATFDDKVLALSDHRYEAPSSTLLGAPGQEVFAFRGVAKGRTTVVLEYKRPWEAQPIKAVEYRVTVR